MIICSEQAGNESAVSVSIIFSCVYHNIFLVHSSFAEHLNRPHFPAKLREHYTGSSSRNVSGEKSREKYVERQLTGMAWALHSGTVIIPPLIDCSRSPQVQNVSSSLWEGKNSCEPHISTRI